MADFSIELKKVPVAELEPITRLPGIGAIRPRIQFGATVALDDVPRPLNGMVLSLPDRQEPVIDDIVLRQGGYFTDRRDNEVIVNEKFAKTHDLKPGDWIHLVLNNRRQELFIVGTAISSEFVYLMGPGSILPDPEHYGVFYIKRSYAEDVFDFDGAVNQVVGLLAPDGRRDVNLVLNRAEQILAPYGVFTTTPLADQPSNKMISQEIEGLRAFAFFMPAIFLTVAALVLNVLLTRLVEQQRTIVGTLKALGYSDGQVFMHFLEFGLTIGISGGLLGCVTGYGLAELMTGEYRNFFEFPELRNRFYPGLYAIGMFISIFCAVVGSVHGTRAVLKLHPAEAMRPKPPKQGGAVLLEHATWLWQRLTSGWRMVLRGILRNRLRTAAGVFAAAMGASVLVTGFMMTEATNYLIDFQFRWVQQSDIDLSLKDERGREALLEASRLPGVDRAEPTLSVPCTFSHGPYWKKGGITGLTLDATLTVPRDQNARRIRIPAAGLAMSRKLAEILHLRRGDTVTVRMTKGERRIFQLPVVEIVDGYIGTVVYANIDYLSHLLSEELILSGVQLKMDNDPKHAAELFLELKELPALEGVNSRSEMIENLEKTVIRNMWVFIGLIVIFAGIVFFGSILNASLVSLAERQRELATLRVLGYGPWQVGSLMLRESLVVTLVGAVLGMPIGYLLTVGAAAIYESEMFRFPVVYSVGTFGWTIVLAVVFTFGAHLFVQYSVHKMNWLEALQAKE
jgi:putative ABC transport system permease protein